MTARSHSTIHGRVEKLIQIGPTDVVIVQVSPRPDAQALLERGVRLYKAGAYAQALPVLAEAASHDPGLSDAWLFQALARLRAADRRPKLLSLGEVEAIDKLLVVAQTANSSDALIYYLRLLVRDDYYNGNGLRCPEPGVERLVALAGACPPITEDRLAMLLRECPLPRNRWYQALQQLLL